MPKASETGLCLVCLSNGRASVCVCMSRKREAVRESIEAKGGGGGGGWRDL